MWEAGEYNGEVPKKQQFLQRALHHWLSEYFPMGKSTICSHHAGKKQADRRLDEVPFNHSAPSPYFLGISNKVQIL